LFVINIINILILEVSNEMAETIKTIGLALIGAVVTLGLAYIAARWHKTP
jgi:hypothetical protein